MDKDDSKNILKKTEKMLKDLGHRGGEIAKSLKDDASYGTKAGMIKVEQLSLENEKSRLLTQLGSKAYTLIRRKKISNPDLTELFEAVQDLDNRIRGKKVALAALRKKRGTSK